MKKVVLCYFTPQELDYIPLDIGYGVANSPHDNNLRLIFQELPFHEIGIEAILQHDPDIAIFFLDNVIWSKVFSLGAARQIALKLRHAKKRIRIGMQSYKFENQDIAQLKADCIEMIFDSSPEYVLNGSIDLLKRKGLIQEKAEEKGNLKDSTSPYLSGVLDPILAQKFSSKPTSRAYLSTSRGCVFGCYYCFRSVKHDTVRFFPVNRVYDEIEYLHDKFSVKNFFFIDDCFVFSKKRLYDFLLEFKRRIRNNPALEQIGILINCRPDTIDEEVVNLFSRLRITQVQVGLQTINPKLQHYMGRKHNLTHFKDISHWFEKYQISLDIDIIAGLPHDTAEYFKETVDFAIRLKPNIIQVKQLYINKDTRFYMSKETYGIVLEEIKRNHSVKLIESATGINEAYKQSVTDYIKRVFKNNKHIFWRWLLWDDIHFKRYIPRTRYSIASVTLNLTYRCNDDCSFCFNKHLIRKAREKGLETDVPISMLKEILPYLKRKYDFKKITISGGEPTMHKKFWNVLSYLINSTPLDIKPSLNTNGIIFSESKNCERLYKLLRSAPPGKDIQVCLSISNLSDMRSLDEKEKMKVRGLQNLIHCCNRTTSSLMVILTITKENLKTVIPLSKMLVEKMDSTKNSVMLRLPYIGSRHMDHEQEDACVLNSFDEVKDIIKESITILFKNRQLGVKLFNIPPCLIYRSLDSSFEDRFKYMPTELRMKVDYLSHKDDINTNIFHPTALDLDECKGCTLEYRCNKIQKEYLDRRIVSKVRPIR